MEKQSTKDLLIPLSVALVTICVVLQKSKSKRGSFNNDENIMEPPHATSYIPYLGSAIEFSKDCKSFVQKWCKIFNNTPVFSALVAGKTYHFITCTEYPVETIFRQKHLSFRPIAIDALTLAFGCSSETSSLFNYDFSKQFASIYHKHLLATDGLKNITAIAQRNIAVSIPKVIAQKFDLIQDQKQIQVPLLQLVQEILFPATMHSVISSVLEEQESLIDFVKFDKKFAMMIGGMPKWMHPDASKGRENLLEKILDEKRFKEYMSSFMKVRVSVGVDFNSASQLI